MQGRRPRHLALMKSGYLAPVHASTLAGLFIAAAAPRIFGATPQNLVKNFRRLLFEASIAEGATHGPDQKQSGQAVCLSQR